MGFHSLDHVRVIVFRISVLAVRIYSDKADTVFPEPVRRLPRNLIRPRNVGAVVAGKEDHKKLEAVEIVQIVGVAIRSKKIETRGGRTNG